MSAKSQSSWFWLIFSGLILLVAPAFSSLKKLVPMSQMVIGYSVQKRPIEAFVLGKGAVTVLFLGVFHGDEPQGKEIILKLTHYLQNRADLLEQKRIILVPVVNPDGLVQNKRTNAHGVDLNRNFPTKDWQKRALRPRYHPGPHPLSEPETKVVVNLLKKWSPQRIVSLHAPLHCVNYDGPAKELAFKMARLNHYPVRSEIGYPTPGSFGRFCAERGIPLITLELAKTTTPKAWQQNQRALILAIRE